MQPGQNEAESIDSSAIELYHRYVPTIFAYIRQHTISREDEEDLTLEVFTVLPGARETRSRVLTDISRIAPAPPNAQRTTYIQLCDLSSIGQG